MATNFADDQVAGNDDGGSRSIWRRSSRGVAHVLSALWGLTWRSLWLGILVFVGVCIFWARDTEEAGMPIAGSGGVIKCRSDVDPAVAQCVQDVSVPLGSAEPGDRTLTYYKFHVERTDCTLFFVRETRDAMGWTWPPTAYVTIQPKKTGVGPINFTMVIPMDASAGAADFTNRFGWWCNPLQWALRGLREHDMPPITITVIRN